MPMIRSHYPADWPAIRERILARSGNRCEWCGVANHAVGARDRDGRWWDERQIDNMNSDVGYSRFGDDYPKLVRIVLTIAHLDTPFPDGRPGDRHNKADCRDEALAALCQRCHLNYDRADHILHAAETRRRKRAEALAATGQLVLSLEERR